MDDKTADEINNEITGIIADSIMGNNIRHHHFAIKKRIVFFNDIIDALADTESEYYKQTVNTCYEYYRLKDRAEFQTV